MKERLGDRLPVFTEEDKALIHDSSDFFGLNHYTTLLASEMNDDNRSESNPYGNGGISEDQDVLLSADPEWEQTSMGWNMVPWGCCKLLHWINQRYNSPDIVITENGCALVDECINGKVDDPERIDYMKSYLEAGHQAIEEGVPLKGYFVWSFMDNFEWAFGFTQAFGLNHVDFVTGKRTPKAPKSGPTKRVP